MAYAHTLTLHEMLRHLGKSKRVYRQEILVPVAVSTGIIVVGTVALGGVVTCYMSNGLNSKKYKAYTFRNIFKVAA